MSQRSACWLRRVRWFLSWILAKSEGLFYWHLFPQNITKSRIDICSVTKCCMLSVETSSGRSLTSCIMWSRTLFVLLFKREKITHIKNTLTCLFVWILQFIHPSDGFIHSYYALVFKIRLSWSLFPLEINSLNGSSHICIFMASRSSF